MKKGIMFYIGLLLLAVFGFALVMLVVLYFSPGTEILGFKFYKYSETNVCEVTTDDSETPLEIGESGKYSEIQINAGYAEVKVEKSNAYDKDSVVIVNNAQGFVMAKDEVKFGYSVLVEGDVLKVNVTEPNGFLNFSKDIKVIIQIANKEANPFASTKFTVKNSSGNITIGEKENSPYSYTFNTGALDLTTDSGSVRITNTVNYDEDLKTQTFPSLKLNIGGGNFTANAESVKTEGDLILQSTSGKFNATGFEANGNIYIKTESGTYDVTSVTTSLLNVECKNGYFYIDNINGNVKFPSADMNIETPYFKSKMIGGNIQVIAGNNIKLEVDSVFGNADISTTGGSVTIGSGKNSGILGTANIKTESGKILAYIKDGNDNIKDFTTDSGEVEIYLLGQVQTSTVVNSKNGNVKVKFQTGKAYKFYFTYQTKTDEYDMSRVSFVDYPNITLENPFVYTEVAENRGEVEIHTDANVELSLFTA